MRTLRTIRNVAFLAFLAGGLSSPVKAFDGTLYCDLLGARWEDPGIDCNMDQEALDQLCTAICHDPCGFGGNGFEASCSEEELLCACTSA